MSLVFLQWIFWVLIPGSLIMASSELEDRIALWNKRRKGAK